MPTSKNRKGHKEKSKQRSLIMKNQMKNKREQLINLFRKAQEEALNEQKKTMEAETTTLVDNVDLGLDDLQINPEAVNEKPQI